VTRDREDAATILAIMASVEPCAYDDNDFDIEKIAFEIEASFDATAIAVRAFMAIPYYDEDGVLSWTEQYAEAESWIRCPP
jgi:hypothetical protein